MKRRKEKKNNQKIIRKILPILTLVLILSLSIGFSAFQETMLVTDTIVDVKINKDVKIYSASIESLSTGVESNYIEKTDDTLSGSVVLPESTSAVTYKIQVKNLDNAEVGLLDIDMSNEALDWNIEPGYTIKTKICDNENSNKCSLGVTKDIFVTVKYKENEFDEVTKLQAKDFVMTFNFETYNSVTYVDIDGTYANEVLNGDTFEVDFDTNAPNYIQVQMGEHVLSNAYYTYANGILTVPDVDADLVITGSSEEICTVTNVKSFGDTCVLSEDNDSSGTVTKGDKVTCGTEGFYVIETPISNTVKMLTEWNLNVSETGNIIDSGADLGVPYSYTYCASTVGYQDEHVRGYLDTDDDESLLEYMKLITIPAHNLTDFPWAYGVFKFDRVSENYGYWTIGDNHDLNTSVYTDNNGGDYPAYVYDSNSAIKSLVDNYAGYLQNALSTNVTGKLISYDELINLGCNNDVCTSAPDWVYQTTYWTGSANGTDSVWSVSTNGNFVRSLDFADDMYCGIRPVIELSKNAISIQQN